MNQPSYKRQLEVAIVWLERLIESGERKEACYQQFFEQNPVVFKVLGYKSFHAFTKEAGKQLPRDEYTGLKPEPDFIVERDDGLFEIFEIKTPFCEKLRVDSNRYRERFTAKVYSYVKQTITYAHYFTRNPANRRKVKELYGLDIQKDLDSKLIVGLNDHMDRAKAHQEARTFRDELDILTYDDILNRLVTEHNRAFGEYESLPGFSFHFVVRFREVSVARRKYFFDIGQDTDKNRISVYLDERDDVCFDVVDDMGRRYQVGIDTSEAGILNEWAYFLCEFGKAEDGFVMSIAVGGDEKDRRVKNSTVGLTVPMRHLVLGCDLNRKNFGRFDIAEKLIYSKTLAFRDKYQIRGYLAQRYDEDSDTLTYIEFDGDKFMHRDEAGNLVQEKKEFTPVLRITDSS